MAEDEENSKEKSVVPLFEQVRYDIYEVWIKLIDLLKSINNDLSEGFNPPSDQSAFTSGIVTFYYLIMTKIAYSKDKKFEKLDELKAYLKKPKELTLDKAVDYFTLISELLEELGISQIGIEKDKRGSELLEK